VHLLVSEQYIDSIMQGATAKVRCMLTYALSLFSLLPHTTSWNCCVWYIRRFFCCLFFFSVCRKPNSYHCL